MSGFVLGNSIGLWAENMYGADKTPPSAEFDAAVIHYRDRFSGVLERTAGGVQGLGRQLGDWLKRFQGDGDASSEEEADAP